ncbi:MAG: tetratricopeptide repeat protein [Bacteroidota bacterium]
MTKLQIILVVASLALLGILYFAFDIRPPKHAEVTAERAKAAQVPDINPILKNARAKLTPEIANELAFLEKGAEQAGADTAKIAFLKQLSGRWYQLKEPAISGYYAEILAEQINTEAAWSIAGTTFSICVQRAKDEKTSDYCSQHSVKAFENAISLNPENVSHRINLALSYTEKPPQDNPMKGILMLVDLNKKYPDSVPVLMQLGRLAIQTGQYKKAVERLSKAVSLRPDEIRAHCLLAKAYQGDGQTEQASRHEKICLSEQVE